MDTPQLDASDARSVIKKEASHSARSQTVGEQFKLRNKVVVNPILKRKEAAEEVWTGRVTPQQQEQREVLHELLDKGRQSPDAEQLPTSEQVLMLHYEIKKQERAKYQQRSQGRVSPSSSQDNRSKEGSRSQSQQPEGVVSENAMNWSETPVFAYYQQNSTLLDVHQFQQIGYDPQTGYLAWDKNHLTNWKVDKLLVRIKDQPSAYEQEQVHGPLYVQALVTLKFLFEEQQVDPAKMQKVRQLYGNISLENTVKLLIRCKLIFAARMTLLDLFDTLSRFKTSEHLLTQFVSSTAARHRSLHTQATRRPILDQELQKAEKHLHQLIAQFVSVAEELHAKVDMVVHGQHRNLREREFVFEGRRIDKAWIGGRLSGQQARLKKEWPGRGEHRAGGLGSGYRFEMRGLRKVRKEVEEKQRQVIEGIRKEEARRERQGLQLSMEETEVRSYQMANLQANSRDESNTNQQIDTERTKVGSVQQEGPDVEKGQDDQFFKHTFEDKENNERYYASLTDSQLSPHSNGGKMQEEGQRPAEARQSKRVVIQEDQAQRRSRSRSKSRGQPRENISRWNVHEYKWQSDPIDPTAADKTEEGHQNQQNVSDKSPLEHIQYQEKVAQQRRAKSQSRAKRSLAQKAIYEKLPEPTLNIRWPLGRSKKSKSPAELRGISPAVFGPISKFQINKNQIPTQREQFSFKIRNTSRRSKRSKKSPEFENYGPVAIDNSKAQTLIDRMTTETMTLEKYSFKTHKRSNPQNQMASRKSTAGEDSSQIYLNQDAQNQKQSYTARPSNSSQQNSGYNKNGRNSPMTLPKNSQLQRPETQGVHLNNEFQSRQTDRIKHRRIGTVAMQFRQKPNLEKGRQQRFGRNLNRTQFGHGAIKGLAHFDESSTLQPIQMFSEKSHDQHRQANEYIPESQELNQQTIDSVFSDHKSKQDRQPVPKREAPNQALDQHIVLSDVNDHQNDEQVQVEDGNNEGNLFQQHEVLSTEPVSVWQQGVFEHQEIEEKRADDAQEQVQEEPMQERRGRGRAKSSVSELKKLVQQKKMEMEEKLQNEPVLKFTKVKQKKNENVGNVVIRQYEEQRKGSLHDSLLSTIGEVENVKDQILYGGQSTNRVLPSGESTHRVLNDGRQHGFQNPKLVPPLFRARSNTRKDRLFMNSVIKNQRSTPAESTRIYGTQRSQVQTGQNESNEQADGNSVIKNTHPSVMQSRKDYDSILEKSSIISVQEKIFQLQSKLDELGIKIADAELKKLEQMKQDLKYSPEKVPTQQSFVPPYGGHTRSSQIREDIKNLENFQRQIRLQSLEHSNNSSITMDNQDESIPLQAQINRDKRIARYNQIDPFERAGQTASRLDYQLYSSQQFDVPNNDKPIRTSAVGSMYQGHNKQVMFSTYYTNVWTTPNNMMYQDRQLSTESIREQREAKVLKHNLEIQLRKYNYLKHKKMKEQISQFYFEKFGITVSEQRQLVMSVEELRNLFLKKANKVFLNAAATKIQRWYKKRYFIRKVAKESKMYIKAVKLIQQRVRVWKATVRDPAKIKARQEAAVALIQRTLRGYQVRRKMEYQVLDARADKLWEYWEKIDIMAKGRFQRRVRRVWLAYKERKMEKLRLAEEAKKKQQQRYRRPTGKAPMPQFGRPSIPTSNQQTPRKNEQQTTQSSNTSIDMQKSKSVIVETKPNPDLNASTDQMANTLKYVQQPGLEPMTEQVEKSEDNSDGHAEGSKEMLAIEEVDRAQEDAHKECEGTNSRNMLETGEDKEFTQRSVPDSSASNVHPTPREADTLNQNNEAANSSLMSSTQEVSKHLESLTGVDGKDISKTVREMNKDENGLIIEEKDEDTPREDIQKSKDDDSDDIARATDQETVQKLGQEVKEQAEQKDDLKIIGTAVDEPTKVAQDPNNKQAQTSICSVCKEEKSITELEFVDEQTIAKIESITLFKPHNDPEMEAKSDPPEVNQQETKSNWLEPQQPQASLRSEPMSAEPDSTRHSPGEPLAEANRPANGTRASDKKYDPSETSMANIENEREIMQSLREDLISNQETSELNAQQKTSDVQSPDSKMNQSDSQFGYRTPKLGIESSLEKIQMAQPSDGKQQPSEEQNMSSSPEDAKANGEGEKGQVLETEVAPAPVTRLTDRDNIVDDGRQMLIIEETNKTSVVDGDSGIDREHSSLRVQQVSQHDHKAKSVEKHGTEHSSEDLKSSKRILQTQRQEAEQNQSSSTQKEPISQKIKHEHESNYQPNALSFKGSGSISQGIAYSYYGSQDIIGSPNVKQNSEISPQKRPYMGSQVNHGSDFIESQPDHLDHANIQDYGEQYESQFEDGISHQDAKDYVQNLLGQLVHQDAFNQSLQLQQPIESDHVDILVKYPMDSKSLGKIIVNQTQQVSMLESPYQYSNNTSSVQKLQNSHSNIPQVMGQVTSLRSNSQMDSKDGKKTT